MERLVHSAGRRLSTEFLSPRNSRRSSLLNIPPVLPLNIPSVLPSIKRQASRVIDTRSPKSQIIELDEHTDGSFLSGEDINSSYLGGSTITSSTDTHQEVLTDENQTDSLESTEKITTTEAKRKLGKRIAEIEPSAGNQSQSLATTGAPDEAMTHRVDFQEHKFIDSKIEKRRSTIEEEGDVEHWGSPNTSTVDNTQDKDEILECETQGCEKARHGRCDTQLFAGSVLSDAKGSRDSGHADDMRSSTDNVEVLSVLSSPGSGISLTSTPQVNYNNNSTNTKASSTGYNTTKNDTIFQMLPKSLSVQHANQNAIAVLPKGGASSLLMGDHANTDNSGITSPYSTHVTVTESPCTAAALQAPSLTAISEEVFTPARLIVDNFEDFKVRSFERARDLYLEGRFGEAERLFKEAGGPLGRYFAKRCIECAASNTPCLGYYVWDVK